MIEILCKLKICFRQDSTVDQLDCLNDHRDFATLEVSHQHDMRFMLKITFELAWVIQRAEDRWVAINLLNFFFRQSSPTVKSFRNDLIFNQLK